MFQIYNNNKNITLIKPERFKVPYSMKSLKELKRMKGLQLQKNGFERFEN